MTVEVKDIPELLLTDVFVDGHRVGWFDTTPLGQQHDVRDWDGERIGMAVDRDAAIALLVGSAS